MDEFWYRLIENLMLAFLPVLASLAAGALIAWIRKSWAEFKELRPDIAYYLEQAANMAVTAAEQAGAQGFIEDKKNYALDIAQRYLDAKGIKVDIELIEAAIEAAVLTEINGGQVKERAILPGNKTE